MKYIVKKVVLFVFTCVLISMMTFFAFTIIPGDASIAKLGTDASFERLEQLREEMGLNKPVAERYVNWLKGVLKGDFGESLQYTGTSVKTLLSERLPATALLSVMSFFLIILFSILFGVLAAKYKDSFIDHTILFSSRMIMAIPSFFLGILLIYIFGFVLSFFQPGTFISPKKNFFDSMKYLFFPAVAIALPKIGMVVRFLRSSIEREMEKDYVRTAYSKGNTKNRVFFIHILKNSLIPVVTFFSVIVADILAGSIIVEQVFNIPGIGRLLINAISNRDYPVAQAVVLIITMIVVLMNFAVDMMYQIIDPRVSK